VNEAGCTLYGDNIKIKIPAQGTSGMIPVPEFFGSAVSDV
jgi:hypothetical protein